MSGCGPDVAGLNSSLASCQHEYRLGFQWLRFWRGGFSAGREQFQQQLLSSEECPQNSSEALINKGRQEQQGQRSEGEGEREGKEEEKYGLSARRRQRDEVRKLESNPRFLAKFQYIDCLEYLFRKCPKPNQTNIIPSLALKECHLRDYMAGVEPLLANKNITESMSSQAIRRCFYGYFRLSPSAKPPAQLACIKLSGSPLQTC